MPRQRLYWSLDLPLRYLGMTLDEWGVSMVGVMPGLYLLNSDEPLLGILLFAGGIIFTYLLRKGKKLSESFLLKSWLLARGLLPAPSKDYPHFLGQKVGK